MSSLSNPAPANNGTKTDPLEMRQAQPGELNAALHLLLAGNGRVSEEQIVQFVAASQDRGVDIGQLQVAVRAGQVLWSLLPVPSPGRTMLVLTPPHAPPTRLGLTPVIVDLMNRVCQIARDEHDVILAQMLVDPSESALVDIYLQAGYIDLAELLYLQRAVRRMIAAPPLPAGVSIETYSEASHARFVDVVAQTYVGSLDCPGLNGLRDMEDVLQGHKHSGDFDPTLWSMLTENGTPLGIMLLSRSMRGDAIELVYLGLTPEARRRGWSDRLMQLALVTTARENRAHLSLAVDARNTPALKLYQRHGLARVGSRRALIRDLRVMSDEMLRNVTPT